SLAGSFGDDRLLSRPVRDAGSQAEALYQEGRTGSPGYRYAVQTSSPRSPAALQRAAAGNCPGWRGSAEGGRSCFAGQVRYARTARQYGSRHPAVSWGYGFVSDTRTGQTQPEHAQDAARGSIGGSARGRAQGKERRGSCSRRGTAGQI